MKMQQLLRMLTGTCVILICLDVHPASAQDAPSQSRDANATLARPEVEYKVFQFPADKIPRIDGNSRDWDVVPASYAIGQDQLRETVKGLEGDADPIDLDVIVKVGWVQGQNHLYFLYEASDDYWDFARPDLHNDIFEVVVDGDLSGGPLIRHMHPHRMLTRPVSWRACSELSHLHPCRQQGLGHGVGHSTLDQGIAVCQRGIPIRV